MGCAARNTDVMSGCIMLSTESRIRKVLVQFYLKLEEPYSKPGVVMHICNPRLMQKAHEFETSLGYFAKLVL
jgi:hypothetical protein